MKPNRTRLKVRLAVQHIPSIIRGREALIDIDQILDAWFAIHRTDLPEQTAVSNQMARDWVRINAQIQDKRILSNALARIYSDGWVLGIDLTTYGIAKKLPKIKAAPSKKKLQQSLSIPWNKWKPGNRAASQLVSPPDGLKRLLDARGIVLDGITRTMLNEIGTALAEGLARGSTREDIADDISYIVGNDERAMMIAGTEMTNAVVQASLDLYRDSGVEMVEWLSADPCDDCQENEDQSPIGIDEEWRNGEPPVHPNCMCDIAPYVVDTSFYAQLEEE